VRAAQLVAAPDFDPRVAASPVRYPFVCGSKPVSFERQTARSHMDEERLAYLAAVNAVTVTSPDLLRALQQQMPSPGDRDSESFGTLSIHTVKFELLPSTPPPSVEAAAMFRLLALFALSGSNASPSWRLPERPDEWSESIVADAASTQPLVPLGNGFGFDREQFRLVIEGNAPAERQIRYADGSGQYQTHLILIL
jgi:hypothetical protein